MRQNSYHHYKMREGFSLVEVVIAVTVLAILTIPILAYVTNASVSTSRGRDTQQANVAGETVMEELNAIQGFEELEETLDPSSTAGPGWTGTVNNTAKKAVVTQDISLDGFAYHVIANVDYNYAAKDSSGNDKTYNAYEVPELKEVYSPNNVVLEEADQAESALSEFYYENQSTNKSAILNSMQRALCIDVEKTTDAGRDIYWVKGYYKFQYGGKEKTFTIRDTKIEISKLKNVYMFYKVLNKNITSETVQVKFLNFTESSSISKLNFYFVLQDTPSTNVDPTVKKPAGYVLDINNPAIVNSTVLGDYNKANYFSNGIDKAGTSPVVQFDKNVVKRETGKRIAAITVDVYMKNADPTNTTYNESDRLVQLKSSKSD